MASDLTGNFDAVVEFGLPAANRMLAAMHAGQRFLHSISLRVDDNQPRGQFQRPSVGGAVDAFGDAVVNHRQIGTTGLKPSQLTAANPLLRVIDPIVNAGLQNAGFEIPPVVPSHFQGLAQLQLSPPSVQVPDASGTLLTVGFEVRSRYLPDAKTSPGTEFMRGEITISAPVTLFSSNVARSVEVDITSDQVAISVNPEWTSTPLSDDDVAGINLLIKNAIRTGFQKSSHPLPDKFTDFKLKMLLEGGQSAVGLLVNLAPLGGQGPATPPGDPGTVGNIFLNSGDDFGFAIAGDFIAAQLTSQFQLQPPSGSFLSYSLRLNPPTIQFQPGQMVLVINGKAHSSHLPDFDFTFTQAFSLQLAASTPGGPLDTAVLVVVGDINPDVHLPWPFGWIADEFIGNMLDPLRKQRDAEVAAEQPAIMDMFNVNKNFGGFLSQLLNPTQGGATQEPSVEVQLAYRLQPEIQASGIVLHGALSVPAWPAPHVEFQEIPQSTKGKLGNLGAGITTRGPDYSALNTWIPGGAIQKFEWSTQGQAQPFSIDENKFVYVQPPPGSEATTSAAASAVTPAVELPPGLSSIGVLHGYTPICLTVRGTRIANSGPGADQEVSGTQCGISQYPVVATGGAIAALPMIAVTQPGPQGIVQVIGHTTAQVAQPGSPAPNVLLHFANNATSGKLHILTQAVADSGRRDAITAVVAVLTPDQLSKAKHVQGITYAEEQGGAWERLYNLKSKPRRPLTLLAGPEGKVVCQQEGELDAAKLAALLRKHLTPGGNLSVNIVRMGLRLGVKSPDFEFNYLPGTPGRQLTLRKVQDRPKTVVFWTSTSPQSIEAVRDLQTAASAVAGPMVLAVNSGEPVDVVNTAAAANGFSAVVVPDPERAISRAYGVSVWPTTVSLDADGLVRQVRYGRVASPQPGKGPPPRVESGRQSPQRKRVTQRSRPSKGRHS